MEEKTNLSVPILWLVQLNFFHCKMEKEIHKAAELSLTRVSFWLGLYSFKGLE